MPLSITRRTKDSGNLIDADGVAASFDAVQFTTVRKMNSILVPIPGEQHFGMPMGPEAIEFTVKFVWDSLSYPCPGKTYAQSLKQWTCNSIYAATPTGSLINDLPVTTGHYVAKNITHERKFPGFRADPATCIKYPRWDVTMNLMKVRDTDLTDCPSFTDYTLSNSYSGSDKTPYFLMTSCVPGDSSSIDTLLSSIKVTHTGQAQAFPLYDEEALDILPPLGNVGPVIDIEFRISSNTDFATVKHWATTRSMIVKTDQRQYDEFDIDNPTSYYSRWIMSAISWDRAAASGGAYSVGLTDKVSRRITMSLTRYWGYELIEV